MTASEWTLAAIAAGGDVGLSPVQLQKSLFLLGKRFPEAVGGGFYQFEPYDYGPFARQVYRDADEWASQRLARVEPPPGRRWNLYRITPAGREYAEELAQFASPDAISYLREVVAWAQKLSFEQLVRAIYKKYPEYRVNSVFSG